MDDVMNVLIQFTAIVLISAAVLWAILATVRFAFGIQQPEKPQQPIDGLLGILDKRRFFAFAFDNALAGILAFITAKSLISAGPSVQGLAAGFVYGGYFLFFEWRFSKTPGKHVSRLRIVSVSGASLSFRQALARTLLRFIEANPLLLGALPAGVVSALSKRRQRLGDMVAGTVVVHAQAGGVAAAAKANSC